MDIKILLTFLGSSVLLTLLPGPDNTFVLIESATGGIKKGIAIAAGLVTGIIFHTILVATGIAYLIAHSEFAFRSIKFFGAGYLLYLAFLAYREQDPLLDTSYIKVDYSKLFLKGLIMNISNPKVLLFFIAFLPQFISESEISYVKQILILGFIFMLQAFVIMSLIAILSGSLNMYIKNPEFWKYIKHIKVVVFIGLAIFILLP